MKRSTKIWLITATALIVCGIAAFGGIMLMFKWDFSKLSTVKYETNEHTVTSEYKGISVITDTADVVFLPSYDGSTSVICNEAKNANHSITVTKDGTLKIELQDERKWYEYIGINFRSPKITVYLPEGEHGALLIKSDTGNVTISKDFKFDSINAEASTGSIECFASASGAMTAKASTGNVSIEKAGAASLCVSVSTGRINVSDFVCNGPLKSNATTGSTKLTNVSCKSLSASTSTGDVTLTRVIANDNFSIKSTTGNITLDSCDAQSISISASAGNVKGTLLSHKIFAAKTSTGRIDVPQSTSGGICNISTSTGDIKISVEEQ